MNNIYYREIIELLLSHREEGMKVGAIARTIYNAHIDIFNPDFTYEKILNKINFYLWKQVHCKDSLFEQEVRGYYKLKPSIAIQLDLFEDYLYDQDLLLSDYNDLERGKSKVNAIQLELFQDTPLD